MKIALVIFTTVCLVGCQHAEQKPPTREQQIKAQFSSWDGSHIALTKLIKENMNDPASYEHVETKYLVRDYYVLVIVKFRGNNKFGGKVLNKVYAQVTSSGEVMETAESDIWGKRDMEREILEKEKALK